ncbi:hypothetical protein H9Q69_012210 [Fusarium xylarioides]|uniref:Myb-like domain-containing protein n=1 Tax=Fusarium xylarioides TaxID=221167 RepID=A0A9P7L197_9HYPO|nr:hypothetical protein H9Q70_001886 [Fusarium xylarioides]KAG5760290.1 hypothetical protein H9Q72_011604 [Fusarium xylarioides]KAG5779933.1 hypothetical protein H9Q73_006411 [Fusarium xylarioides]KAG5788731.1 hypothetical protein H9Q69_012210 [Fusarium xylarioides]KAG5816350.1 hypothetical protein H9Q74_011174 [Fusarium xylarioides]
MSDAAVKPNAWTDEAKNELLLRIIAQLKPEGKSINWSEINMEGRTVKSLQNQWTFFNKKIEAFKAQSNDGSSPSTPAKKATPARKRGSKVKKGGSDEEEVYETPKVTPRKRRAPKTPDSEPKAVKKELSDAVVKDEDMEDDDDATGEI